LIEDQDLVDRIYRRSQIEGAEHNASNADIIPELIENMKSDFTWAISEEKKRRIEESSRQMESYRLRNEKQTQEYYKSRMASWQTLIDERKMFLEFQFSDEKSINGWQRDIRLFEANISALEKERDERLALINQDTKPTIEEKILSLNLITII
ncbi:MAG: hypothetical protein HUJ98_08710, partial [Bacteroidaceae bacterium]|nr:hypothetical protein [Bacteroidaceae bacterium]